MSSAREALGSLATEELALAILRLLRVDPYVDSLTEQITQTIQRPASRRGFLAGISKLLAGGMILPILSLEPVPTHAAEQRG
jgi:hypothetical protein